MPLLLGRKANGAAWQSFLRQQASPQAVAALQHGSAP
jgi:hypothetical protein